MGNKEKILTILEKAQTTAEGEIAEKIELARKAIAEDWGQVDEENWLDAFTAGYYASWAEGLANEQQPNTPLCKLLNEMINLLSFKPDE